jgi:hypothetical protein
VDQTAWDIVAASNAGAIVSAVVAFPQLVKALRERESVRGVSGLGLGLQLVAILLFGYVNVRLGLWVAAVQNAGVLASLLVLLTLKYYPRPLPQAGEEIRQVREDLEPHGGAPVSAHAA